MKTQLLLCGFLLTLTAGLAQADYFQQEVDYQIDVRLDDQAHVLHGALQLQYRNNAPQALDTLYIHLWPNAYRNRQTAYARQALRMGNTDFYYAGPDQRGGIDSLNFRINGDSVAWSYHPEHIDIARILLPAPLQPGAALTLETPFRVDLPYCFSRLGHAEQSYQITQWYPKPAVYDQQGWHPMPYLDMGEFYSEFGRFDVRITLPKNYRLAATGELQNPEEHAWLQGLAANPLSEDGKNSFPPSDSETKTLRFTAKQVHDFAWFADKRFQVRHDTLQLASGRVVDAWAFFTKTEQELWQDATDYVKRSLRFYSGLVGEYPYPQATAVETTLGAGGGMEYPMITNIGYAGSARSLDEVITHEVGHNWFYGILGSNERVHPWMDEGLNSYYEQRYMQTFYEDREPPLPDLLLADTSLDLGRLGYLYQARRRLDQAPDTHSDEFAPINYFVSAYDKPAKALALLHGYVGEATFDAAMQAYYDQWKFRHPQPDDFREVLEAETGEELGWLFEGLLYSNQKTDYKISKVQQRGRRLEVQLKNRGGVDCPVPLAAYRNGRLDSLYWIPGFEGKKNIRLQGGDATLQLDPHRLTLDLYRVNNRYAPGSLLPALRLPQLRLLGAVQNSEHPAVFVLPVVSWNNYDKTMPGLLLYNHTLPEQRFEFALAPMYGIGTGRLTGLGDVHANFYPTEGELIYRLRAGLSARRFTYRTVNRFEQDLGFTRLQPYVEADFATPHDKRLRRQLRLEAVWLEEERQSFEDPANPGLTTEAFFLQRAELELANERAVSPFSWLFALEHAAFDNFTGAQRYVKATVEWQAVFHYGEDQAAYLRLFGGYFLYNSEREANYIGRAAFNLIDQGSNDYRYDNYYLGRTDNTGIWSQQLSVRNGGFKTPVDNGFNLGRSNDYLLAANFHVDLPREALFGIPIKPYIDLAYAKNRQPIAGDPSFSDQFFYSGGLMIAVLNNAVAVHFPLLNSANLEDRLAERGNYWSRISFRFSLQQLNPWKAADRLRF